MTLNVATLKTRSLTAVVFVIVMLAGLLWNFWSFFILCAVIQIGCWMEYLKLVEKIYLVVIDVVIKWLFAICGFTLLIVFGIHNVTYDAGMYIAGFEISFKLLFWFLLFALLLVFIFQNKKLPNKAKWICFGGFAYITMPILMLLDLATTNYQENFSGESGTGYFISFSYSALLPCGIIFSIWINDTMAYIVGSMIGKTPFSKISPKKTWEGIIGGVILCIVVIALLGYFIPVAKVIGVKYWIAIAVLCAIAGTIGDLFESKLKRMANVKDSGSIMPGHGGFLDRFDSLLFAAPMVWLYVKLFI
jgi:phosphatidate cytidylyltransferase